MCFGKSEMNNEVPVSPVNKVVASSGNVTANVTAPNSPTASSSVKKAATPPSTLSPNYGSGWHGT